MRFVATALLILYIFFVPGPIQTLAGQSSVMEMAAQRASYAGIALLALAGVAWLLMGARPHFRVPALWAWSILALGGAILLSVLMNGVTPLGAMIGLLDYGRYPLLGLMLLGMPRRQFLFLLGLIVVSTLVQLPLAVMQFVSVGFRAGDDIAGTLGGLGGQNMLSVALTYVLALAIALPGRWYWRPAAVAGAMVALAVIGDVGFLFVAPALVVALYVLVNARLSWPLVAAGIGVGLLLVATFAGALWAVNALSFEVGIGIRDLVIGRSQTSENLVEQVAERVRVLIVANGRSDTVLVVMLAVLDRPSAWLSGFGVNAFYKGQIATLAGTPFADAPHRLTRGENVSQLGWSDPEILELFQATAQIPRVLGEMGMIGLLAFALLFLALWMVSEQALRRSSPADLPYVRAFRCILVLYALVLPYYVNAWRLDVPSVVVWVLAAMITTPLLEDRAPEPNPQLPLVSPG